MAFHALADYQNHVIGWCNGNRVPLEMGPWYDFREPLMHDDPVTPDVALEGLME